MSAQTIQQRVIHLVADHFSEPEDRITTATSFADLGADSLDTIDVVMAVEEEFHMDVDDDKADACKTVADLVALVEPKGTPA